MRTPFIYDVARPGYWKAFSKRPAGHEGLGYIEALVLDFLMFHEHEDAPERTFSCEQIHFLLKDSPNVGVPPSPMLIATAIVNLLDRGDIRMTDYNSETDWPSYRVHVQWGLMAERN